MGKVPSSLPLALTPTRSALFRSTTSSSISSTSSSSTSSPCSSSHSHPSNTLHQVRNANFIARPRRPYTFTQLVQLSDGSTYTVRTTSPQPLYRAVKDTRNTLMWQPTEKSLKNVELDEAGRLAAFRERFGRGFDAPATTTAEEGAAAGGAEGDQTDARGDGGLADLISGFAPQDNSAMKDSGPKRAPTRRK